MRVTSSEIEAASPPPHTLTHLRGRVGRGGGNGAHNRVDLKLSHLHNFKSLLGLMRRHFLQALYRQDALIGQRFSQVQTRCGSANSERLQRVRYSDNVRIFGFSRR